MELTATGSARLGCGGYGSVAIKNNDGVSGSIAIANTLTGSIKLTQGSGADPASPQITLANDDPPGSITLAVGGPAAASLTLSATEGITLKFGDTSVVLNADGATVTVADSIINVTADGITLNAEDSVVAVSADEVGVASPGISLTADGDYSLKCMGLNETAAGQVNRAGALTQMQ